MKYLAMLSLKYETISRQFYNKTLKSKVLVSLKSTRLQQLKHPKRSLLLQNFARSRGSSRGSLGRRANGSEGRLPSDPTDADLDIDTHRPGGPKRD